MCHIFTSSLNVAGSNIHIGAIALAEIKVSDFVVLAFTLPADEKCAKDCCYYYHKSFFLGKCRTSS